MSIVTWDLIWYLHSLRQLLATVSQDQSWFDWNLFKRSSQPTVYMLTECGRSHRICIRDDHGIGRSVSEVVPNKRDICSASCQHLIWRAKWFWPVILPLSNRRSAQVHKRDYDLHEVRAVALILEISTQRYQVLTPPCLELHEIIADLLGVRVDIKKVRDVPCLSRSQF